MPKAGAAWLAAAAVIAAVAVAGCGRSDRLEIVSGEIVFTDGHSVVGGVVEFDPVEKDGRPARAAIGADGRFSLRSGSAVGARPGRYRVAVVQMNDPAVAAHHHDRPRVHPRFGRFDTSGLVESVTAGRANNLRIVVEPLAPSPAR